MRIKERKVKNFDYKSIIDFLYLIIVALFVSYYFLINTEFHITWLGDILLQLQVLLFAIVILRLCLQEIKIARGLLLFSVSLVFYESYIQANSEMLLLNVMLIIIGSIGMPIKKLATAYLIPTVTLLVVTISNALMGNITNLIYVQEKGERVRYCLGAIHYFWITAPLFYAICAYLIIRSTKIRYVELVILECLNVVIYYFCRGRNHLICITLVLLGCAIIKYRENKQKEEYYPNRIISILMVFSPIICAISSISMILCYNDQPILSFISKIISNRLKLCKTGYQIYGFSLWGQKIITFGAKDIERNGMVIDSTYIYLAIKYGVVILGVLLISMFFMNCKAMENKLWILLFLMSVNAMQFIIDRSIFYINCNFFLWFIFGDFTNNEKKERRIDNEEDLNLEVPCDLEEWKTDSIS